MEAEGHVTAVALSHDDKVTPIIIQISSIIFYSFSLQHVEHLQE